jgi:predicted histone-like DNA-binding protein
MALNYSVALRPNPFDKDASPKAYATAQINGELSLKQLSKRVSSQTTVSRADVVAVLTATVDNLLDALQEGKQVDFGELGKFRLQILSQGAETLADFTSENIQGVNIQYIPGEDLKNIFAGLEFQPVASRKAQSAALRAEKEGKDVAELVKTDQPSEGNV